MSIEDWFRPKWQHSNPHLRLRALEQVTDQRVLADIAKRADYSHVRKSALERVTDQSMLADIAKYDKDLEVRRAAVERVIDQRVLADAPYPEATILAGGTAWRVLGRDSDGDLAALGVEAFLDSLGRRVLLITIMETR